MSKRRVLLVEDHPEVRRSLRASLQGMGVEIVEAANGRAAMTSLAEAAPDLICLDVVLPECSGYELCEHIRQDPRLCHVPILMMSERNLPNECVFAEEAGADLFLTKPFPEGHFRSAVTKLLSRASPSPVAVAS